MFDHTHYVPLLKAKQGELWALKELSPQVKSKLTPLLELLPIPWDYSEDRPKKTLSSHLEKTLNDLNKSWDKKNRIFLDFIYVDSIGKKKNGISNLFRFFRDAIKSGVNAIPVTALDRDDDYQKGVYEFVKAYQSGICLRIQNDELGDLGDLKQNVDDLLNFLNLTPNDCDIIIDLAYMFPETLKGKQTFVFEVLNNFPYVRKWQTVTFASTCFPEFLEQEKDSLEILPREDWILWNKLVKNSDQLVRIPTFGDYSVQHPELFDSKGQPIKSSVNLRYASNKHWLVYKGKEKNRYGHDQFNIICGYVVKRPEYGGENFCWADYYIKRCANNLDGPGNPSKWRQVGTNRHLALTVNQLSALYNNI